jgi:hypothetical protein
MDDVQAKEGKEGKLRDFLRDFEGFFEGKRWTPNEEEKDRREFLGEKEEDKEQNEDQK